MTVYICLIRHGETSWNATGRLQGRTDTPLSDVGRRQAKTLGPAMARLQKEKGISRWDAVYSSPLQRAVNTAMPIGDHFGIKLRIDDDLVERGFGEIEGLTRTERDARFPKWREDETNVKGLETTEALRHRAHTVINRIIRSHTDENLIVVSHGGFLHAIMDVLPIERADTGGRPFPNASYTLIRYTENDEAGDGVWDVIDVHRTEHLEV